jgi:hypothetical protein
MKYRKLSAAGDYQFGKPGIFLENSPATVVQAIRTRLALWAGEWFLDSQEGTAYLSRVLGYGTQGTRDVEIRERIFSTPGVLELEQYESSVDDCRRLTVTARVQTIYGTTTFSVNPES